MAYAFVEADTLPQLRATLRYRMTGLPVDLTLATATLRFATGEGVATERLMEVMAPPTQGIARYVFQPGEVTPGTMRYEVLVIFSNGGRLTTLDFKTLEVRARV